MNFLKRKRSDKERIIDLENQKETLKSLLRTAEEALRKEEDNHHFYRGLLRRTEVELNMLKKVLNK